MALFNCFEYLWYLKRAQGNRDSLCICAQYDIYNQVMHMFYKYIAKTAPAKEPKLKIFLFIAIYVFVIS